MKFIKDLLLFELATTGTDTDKDSVLQLSAMLLDKDNLLEKANFNSYVRVSYLDSVIWTHAKLLNVDCETVKGAPKSTMSLKNFTTSSPIIYYWPRTTWGTCFF